MKTETLKEKLETILDNLFKKEDISSEITLTYCDILTVDTSLEMTITVKVIIADNGGADENLVSKNELDWVKVDEFSVKDEEGDEAIDIEQKKELVRFVNTYTSNYYFNLF